MKHHAFLCLLALAPLGARAIEREAVRTFPVQPGCVLKVDLYRGAIDIEESDDAAITVTADFTFAGDSEREADRLQAAVGLTTSQEANTVVVRADDPAGRGVHLSWNDRVPVDLDCKIRVPRRCDVELRTRDGGITVGSVAGRIIVRAVSGNLNLRRITGSIEAITQSGDIIISRCSGTVVARTGRGLIRAGTLNGHASFKNSGGDIEVLAARGGLEAEAEAGDVTIGCPNNLAGDVKITTAYGSIVAKIDPAANCEVQASSFWGHVESKLPLAIESGGEGKGKLFGQLNQGGPLVMLHANGGHVRITPGETLFN